MKPPFAFLRQCGHVVLGYIDDTIFIEDTAQGIDNALHLAIPLFDGLGLTISVKKSIMRPVQKIEYLGFILNSRDMTVSLTEAKKVKIKNMARRLLSKHTVAI